MMKTLDSDNTIAEMAPFMGQKDLLIIGDGSVIIEKSIDKGVNYYPMTDSNGDIVVLESDNGVIYNAKIENTNGEVRYRIALDSGSAKFEVV